jgi:type I restriction enzyme R subunit
VTVNGEVGFVETFLNPEMLTEVLIQYMLNIPAPRNEILILRPYQIYATRAGKQRLLETDGNGFFWHATGSGKTLTSYMLTKAVTEHPKFAKTVMLLDRNDLADQTIEEYGFFSNTDLQVDRGRKLLNAFVDPTQKTVTTTIQSFSRLLTKQAKALKGYTNEPVCFIVDECHRSTFGKMFQIIKETFPQAQFIGFTGTPLLAENANLKERTTKDIFGEPIHIYTIKNAIDDGNVLKFELHEVTIGVSNNSTIEKDSYYYSTPARHQQVASYLSTNIWKHTGHKTVNKKLNFHDGYTAMFATDSIKSAHNYWQLLTPLLEKQGRTTAIVFSVANKEYEEIEETTARDWFIEAVTHYDTTFGTNFRQLLKDDHNFSDVRKTYVSDVTRRVKNKEIDLVIVSDMLLTGFDAKTLNTIYLDKNLKHHNLLQAKSRTNRTYPRTNKQSGNVILFSDRNMVPAVNESIILYSNNLNVEGVIERRNYQQLYNTVVEQVRELKRLHPTPETIDAIEEIVDLKNVAQTYSALSNNLNRIQTYDEWETVDWPKTGVTEEEMEHYYSSIIEKKNQLGLLDPTENDDDQWEQLEFAITNITVVAIDIAYINNLLRNLVYAPPKQKMKAFDIAEKAIQVSTDPTVEQMKQILLELLSEHEKINSEEEMWELLEFKKVQKLKRKYREYSTELDIEETVLQKMVEMLQTNERYPEEYADNLLNQKNLNIIKKVPYRKKIETAVKELANYPLP